MIIQFFVNGICVDTYRCVSTNEQLAANQLCAEDNEAIERLKMKAYCNYGYPCVTVMSPDTRRKSEPHDGAAFGASDKASGSCSAAVPNDEQ